MSSSMTYKGGRDGISMVTGKRSGATLMTSFTCASCGFVDDIEAPETNVLFSPWDTVTCSSCGTENLICCHCRTVYNAIDKDRMRRHWKRNHKDTSAHAAAQPIGDDEDVIGSTGGDWNYAGVSDSMGGADDSEGSDYDGRSAQETGDEPAIGDSSQPDASNQPDANLVDESEAELDTFQINVALDNLQPAPRSMMNGLPAMKSLPEGVLPIHAFPEVGGREKNSVFFYQEYLGRSLHGRSGGGMQGSAWRAFHKVNSYGAEDILDPRDADFLFETMEHALDSKGQQRENFFGILSRMYERVPKTMTDFINLLAPEQKQRFIDFQAKLETDEKLSGLYDDLCDIRNNSVQVPSTPAEADALLLRGRNSLYGQLPDLTVHTDDAGNAYIKLMDLISVVVAMGVPISYIQDENGLVSDDRDDFNPINGCKAARDILERLREDSSRPFAIRIGLMIFWSDGFQRAYVKQKDNNVWILTVTFLNTVKNSRSKFHTYCLAVGKAGADNSSIVENVLRELEEVEKARSLYCGRTNKIVKCQFAALSYSSDRIERHKLLSTIQLGTFGLRWGWAGMVSSSVPTCNSCFRSKFTPNGRWGGCADCTDWGCEQAYQELETIQHYPKFEVGGPSSPAAPSDRTVNETHHIPKEQSNEWIREGLIYAFYNCTHGETRSGVGAGYRWHKYVAEAYLRSMGIGGSLLKSFWANVKANIANSSAGLDFIPYVHSDSCLLKMPAFINSPMHLVMHGVATDSMEIVHKHLTKLQKLSTFETFANRYLQEIERFRLGYCRTRRLPKTFWLAEDILGLTRIMPCVYGLAFADNLKLTSSESDHHTKTMRSVLQLLNSLHVMVSTLMSPTKSTDIGAIKKSINIFLSCTHRACHFVYGQGDKMWASKGNFLSLLNLPKQIELYGPVRWYWEGSSEAHIHEIKPHLVENLRKTPSYFAAKLSLIFKRKLISWIRKTREGDSNDSEETYRQSKRFYRYAEIDDLRAKLDEALPVSAFQLKGYPGVWAALGNTRDTVEIVALKFIYADIKEYCGMPFFKTHLAENSKASVNKKKLLEAIDFHLILFPFICGQGLVARNNTWHFEGRFALIYEDWDILTTSGKSIPSLSPSLSNKIKGQLSGGVCCHFCT
ncbi:hypothetical protein THAOC_09946 [Thalassiosira oceanica]|uniref:Uncharacterized protein n=1 Tax=Thalassiosira oceanica TaxID=159749 RepID=K0SV65_THAOC|nr:hypothetical protein THAOC_09946 [Thalassiosira oceanica]|eukprot:EJK68844.1 hypothetical protein THAOC_09946 [Thalassiosira oceanica]